MIYPVIFPYWRVSETSVHDTVSKCGDGDITEILYGAVNGTIKITTKRISVKLSGRQQYIQLLG